MKRNTTTQKKKKKVPLMAWQKGTISFYFFEIEPRNRTKQV